MKFRKMIPLFVTICVLASVLGVSIINKTSVTIATTSSTQDENNATADVFNITNDEFESEMKGVWVTYMELSMENESDKSENRFRQKFDAIAKNAKIFGFNTLIVQVRPFCDALYESELFPYSHILSGEQGKNPNYDALKIMCEICKNYELKIHAWVNPYRVAVSKTPGELSGDNPYIKNKNLGFETENGIYLDPSNPDAQKLICDGIEEIIKNYDVDGIQFDDYFYPENMEDEDKSQYDAYVDNVGKDNSMNIDNWRKANVNMLISQVYRAVHSAKSNVVFGISPQGNIDNNEGLYADVKSWCSCRGFIDYICPQIYFSLDNPRLSFEDSLNDWESLDYYKDVRLYVGIAGYKAGSDSDEGTWLNQNDILSREYQIINESEKSDGFMLYSYTSLEEDKAKSEINNLKKALK